MHKRKVAIVTDGACSLTPAQGKQLGIHIAPVYVSFGEKTYRAGVDLENAEFYRLLRVSDRLPTITQPTASDFTNLFTQLADEVDEIVTIVTSQHLSTTLRSAETAREQFNQVPVHIIDSASVSLGLGMMAIAAAEASAQGQDAKAVVQLVDKIKKHIHVLFAINTLDYFHKDGLSGYAIHFPGVALNRKFIISIKDGRSELLDRQRAHHRAITRILELMEEKIGDKEVHVAVLYCEVPDDANQLEQHIRSRFDCVEFITADIGPVLGIHTNSGTLGVVFYPD